MEQGQVQSALESGKMDVEAHMEAALARIMAAASRLNAGKDDGMGQERSRRVEEAIEEDEGLQITGAKEAHKVERGATTCS